jgi:hypothetical protein
VGLALLVVLEALDPVERLAFVLHDMFAVPFEEIAPMVGRTPAAARQLASRARRRVQGATPAGQPDMVGRRAGWTRMCVQSLRPVRPDPAAPGSAHTRAPGAAAR